MTKPDQSSGEQQSASSFRHDLTLRVLHNGLDFIKSALDYLAIPDGDQGAKYAVLHLAAGIELVMKARLEREHWTLVFQDPRVATRKQYETGDFVSANLDSVLARLTGVCETGLTEQNKRQLKRFKTQRNKLEHFGFEVDTRALQANAVGALSILLDFIVREFPQDDLTTEERDVIEEIRGTLQPIEMFVSKRRIEIAPRIAAARELGHAIVRCPICFEDAVDLVEEVGACLFCGHNGRSTDFEDEYLDALGHWSKYVDIKDGGEWPVYFCPGCGGEHLVFDRWAEQDAVCFACGSRWSPGAFDLCTHCGEPYEQEEEDGAICSECFRNLT